MVPFVVSSSVLTASGVLLVSNFDAGVAAGCAGAASLGGVAGNLVGPWCDRRVPAVSVAVWLAWCASSVGLLLAASASWLVLAWVCAFSSGGVLGVYRVLRRHALASWGETWTRRAGPAGRVGATLGAFAGSAVALLSLPGVVVAGVVLAATLALAPARHASVRTPVVAASRGVRAAMFVQAFTVAVLGFGPVVVYVVLVSELVGPWAVGWAMALYAASALLAPVLAARVPRVAPVSLVSMLYWVALANGAWMLCFVAPALGAFVARAASGVSLFMVEGSFDVRSVREHTYAESTLGRSVGAAVSGFAMAGLMGWFGSVLPALAVTAAVSVVSVAALVLWGRVRRGAPA